MHHASYLLWCVPFVLIAFELFPFEIQSNFKDCFMLVMLQDFQNNLQTKSNLLISLNWFLNIKNPQFELMINSPKCHLNPKLNQIQTFAKTKVGAIVLSTQLPQ